MGDVLVERQELVVDHFGRWPEFHDAVMYELAFRLSEEREVVDMKLRHAEMTPELDARGYYKLVKHCNVHLRFHGVTDIEIEGHAPVTTLFDLVLRPCPNPEQGSESGMAVEWSASYGMQGTFWCKRAEVVSLVPTEPQP